MRADRLEGEMNRAVLIVDDEEDIAHALEDLLDLHGIEVASARSGIEGLDALKKRRFGAVVSDYRMQGMDGIAFLQEAAKLVPGVPRILITAFPHARVSEQAHRAGVVLVVTKPFHPVYFANVVRVVLEGGTVTLPGQGPVREPGTAGTAVSPPT